MLKKVLIRSNLYPLIFTLAFILVLIQYSFSTFESIFYDLWIKLGQSQYTEKEIILIPMDDTSNQFLGEFYPYTYSTHTRFLKKLLADKPKMVNFLVDFEEPISPEENKQYSRFVELLNSYASEIDFEFSSQLEVWGKSLPPPDLNRYGSSLALINSDSNSFSRDNVSRKAIVEYSSEDSFHLKLAKIMAKESIQDELNQDKFYVSEADATFIHHKYLLNPLAPNSIQSIPFYRVLSGAFPAGFFKDKIVLIGSQFQSNPQDFILTPFNKETKAPKLNVHASIIRSFVNNETLLVVSPLISDIVAIVLGFILSLTISQIHPTKGLLTTLLIIVLVFLIAALAFIYLGLWIKLSHITLSIFVVYYIWVPYRAIAEYQTRYAIEEEAKILKQVDDLKQNFISLMSHDLKTPVAKIAGIADNIKLKLGSLHGAVPLVDDIIAATKELNQFINSILDLTKVESKEVNIQFISKDINKILESIVERLTYEIEKNGQKVETQLDPLYPIKIDPKLIDRVFSNLIENAIKYSGHASEILVKTWDDQDWVYIEISDNGPGIPADKLPHIFDKFYRVRNDTSMTIKGSGLGLYLVKYFIELHKGDISVESEEGKGTSFLVKLRNQ